MQPVNEQLPRLLHFLDARLYTSENNWSQQKSALTSNDYTGGGIIGPSSFRRVPAAISVQLGEHWKRPRVLTPLTLGVLY